ncbi:hypothetical protein [Umezawaea beigongshangensis]|uniref:hypothetical protein n=1 Tax=Umezawaea beigongshangensis TaxID=2780383 RepID=UPI0018F1D0FE|nr:hypothetical protein [Umezawaea beigongshangensis]
MRKTFTATALLVATVGGIAAGTGAANAQQLGTDTASTERALPLVGDLPLLNDLLSNLPLLGGGGLPGLGG